MSAFEDDDPLDRELTDEQLSRMRPMPLAHRAWILSGFGRSEFCRAYGVPEDLLIRWERGEETPDAVATAYLQAILADPAAVAAAYTKSRQAA
ncbi:MAG: hypothetical protein RLY86_3173 [Pseudomonadota bacterium]|jgi:DNA-binding transcriptional regulator YiaG